MSVEPAGGGASGRPALALPWLLLALTGAVYAIGLPAPFQFDDVNVIVDEPSVHSLAAWWTDLGRGLRPLLKLSYAINWAWAPEAAAFRVVNIAVHALNVMLVLDVARRLALGWGRSPAQARDAALVAAALFALHPALTEAVTYVSGRSTSLSASFCLAAMRAHLMARLGAAPASGAWAAAPLWFLLALAAKESAIALPLAVLAWESGRPDGSWRDAVRRSGPMCCAAGLAVLAFSAHPLYAHRLAPDLSWTALAANLPQQVEAWSYLVRRLVVVWPLNIDPDLGPAGAAGARVDLAQAVALAATLGLALLVWRASSKRPWLRYGMAWFVAFLLPTNSLLPRLDLANDRQVYLAGIGVFIGCAIEGRAWAARRSAGLAAGAATVALLAVLATFTALRNAEYLTEVGLWEQTARQSPHKPRVWVNLGYAYGRAGCLDRAEAAYREALRLDPDYSPAADNLEALAYRRTLTTVPASACGR